MKSVDKVRFRLRERLAQPPARSKTLRGRRGRMPAPVRWLDALHTAARRASWRLPRRLN